MLTISKTNEFVSSELCETLNADQMTMTGGY